MVQRLLFSLDVIGVQSFKLRDTFRRRSVGLGMALRPFVFTTVGTGPCSRI